MKKIVILSVILIGCILPQHAQTVYNLDLEKSIAIAKEKSYNMLSLLQDFKIAENNLKSATSKLKTHVNLKMTAPNFSRSLNLFSNDSVKRYYTSKVLSYGTTLNFNQYLPTAGQIYLTSSLTNGIDYSFKTQEPQFATFLGFTQPLNALYGYNEIKSALKIAELNYESSKKSLRREELNIVYIVSSSFYNLISAQKRTEIAQLDLERQKEANNISQSKYKAGLIKEVDALQMEVDLAEAQNSYELAQITQTSSLNEFKQLIGIDLKDSVLISTEFKYEPVIVDPEKAVKLALENRLELRMQDINIESQRLTLKSEKSNGMIQSSINLSLGKVGAGKAPDGVNPMSNSIDTKTAFQKTFSDYSTGKYNYGIGFTVSIPLIDFGENRARVNAQQAKLQQSILQKQEQQRNIEREVINLVADLNSSLKRLQLLEKNVILADKSFEITRQRYADGDIDSQGLALERKRLNTAYTNHLSAYINYQLFLADLMRKTFYDFQKNELVK